MNIVAIVVIQQLVFFTAFPLRMARLLRSCEYYAAMSFVNFLTTLVNISLGDIGFAVLFGIIAIISAWAAWKTRNDDDDDIRRKRKKLRSKLRVKVTGRKLVVVPQ